MSYLDTLLKGVEVEYNSPPKTDLLIIDDFGLTSLEQQQRLDLLEIIEDRHGRKSTIIASQLPVSSWYEIIGEETIADFERREHEKKKAVSPK